MVFDSLNNNEIKTYAEVEIAGKCCSEVCPLMRMRINLLGNFYFLVVFARLNIAAHFFQYLAIIYLLTFLSYVAPPTVEPFPVTAANSTAVEKFYQYFAERSERCVGVYCSLGSFCPTMFPQSRMLLRLKSPR